LGCVVLCFPLSWLQAPKKGATCMAELSRVLDQEWLDFQGRLGDLLRRLPA